MARIGGINIPVNKHTWVALTSIYGIGRTTAYKVCEQAGVDPKVKVKDLAEPQVEDLVVIAVYVIAEVYRCEASALRLTLVPERVRVVRSSAKVEIKIWLRRQPKRSRIASSLTGLRIFTLLSTTRS